MALSTNAQAVPTTEGTFIFTETTGAYSVSNTNGYGAPNPVVGDATAASLEVFLPDGTTRFPSSDSVVFNAASDVPLYPLFPNTAGAEFEITGEMLGYGEDSKCADGVYLFVYTVTIDGDDYVTSFYKEMMATVKCCIAKLYASGVSDGCGCGKKATRFEKGSMMLTGVPWAVDCGDIDAAAKGIVHAIEICDGCAGC